MPSSRRTWRALALAIPLVLLLASCGDDEPDGASAADADAVDIDTRDQWCAVVGEADELFTATDTDGDEFAVRQVGYEQVRGLLARLANSLDQVDAGARDDVAEALDFGTAIASAFVEADDEDAAIASLEDVFGVEGFQSDGPGATWILDNCEVDIDG